MKRLPSLFPIPIVIDYMLRRVVVMEHTHKPAGEAAASENMLE